MARSEMRVRRAVRAPAKRRRSKASPKKTRPQARGHASGIAGWLLGGVALLCVWAAFEYRSLPDVTPLLHKNPTTSALIEQRAAEAREDGKRVRRQQRWVGLSQMSRHATDAVLLSEDAAFFQHEGVDTREMRKALVDAWEKGALGRGASTITMQLAKNLWLSTDRSIWRKLKELLLTQRLEEHLPKKRILTLYLNIAEWGDGVYGIEAGAREHFGKSAFDLTPAEAAVMASLLPAPRTWSVAKRSKTLRQRALRLIDRMAVTGRLASAEAAQARMDIDGMFGASVAARPGTSEASSLDGASEAESELESESGAAFADEQPATEASPRGDSLPLDADAPPREQTPDEATAMP